MRATPEGGFVHNDESDELTAAPTRLFLSSSFFFFWRDTIFWGTASAELSNSFLDRLIVQYNNNNNHKNLAARLLERP